MKTILSRYRYYYMYWFSPIPAYGAALLAHYTWGNPFVNALAATMTLFFWWMLAMLTEETMRLGDGSKW